MRLTRHWLLLSLLAVPASAQTVTDGQWLLERAEVPGLDRKSVV